MLVALHAAVANAEHAGIAVHVPKQLGLDVPQGGDVLLQVDVPVSEGRARFDGDPVKKLVERISRLHNLNPLATSAMHGLNENRVDDLLRHLGGTLDVGEDAVASRHHRNVEAQRGVDGVGFVAHGLHAGHRGPDEVDPVRADQLGKLRILREKADAGMQRVGAFVLGYAQHAHGVQVALVRGVAADADHRVLLAEHVHGGRLHVRVGLHQHHPDAVALGDADQLGRRAPPGMNQHATHGPDKIGVRVLRPVRHHDRALLAEHPRQHAGNHVGDRFLGNRNLRIYVPQILVELRQERMLHQALHRTADNGEIVREDRVEGQVRRHDDLPGERHARPGQVVRLHQRMGDEARLGTPRAVTKSEHDDRQVVIANESGDAVVDRCHGEQGTRALLRLHAARGDEADHRQVLLGALHQQPAEFLGAGHVEGAGLKVHVGDHRAHPDVALAGLEVADAGHHAARRNAAVQRFLDGQPETRELARIRAQQIGVPLVERGEKRVDEGLVPRRAAVLGIPQHVLDQQVAVGNVEPVPEVLAPTDVLRRDPPVVGLALAFRLHERQQQAVEEVGDHHEQRVGQVRKDGLLPFLDGSEEVGAFRHPRYAQVPVDELPAKLHGLR